MLERNRWSRVKREELKWAAVEREFGNHRDVDDERSRPQEPKARQEFHASIRSVRHTRFAVHWPRELMHDAQVYRAYLKDAERLREDGAFIRRVVLDHELKREYQQFPGVPRALQPDAAGRDSGEPREHLDVFVS